MERTPRWLSHVKTSAFFRCVWGRALVPCILHRKLLHCPHAELFSRVGRRSLLVPALISDRCRESGRRNTRAVAPDVAQFDSPRQERIEVLLVRRCREPLEERFEITPPVEVVGLGGFDQAI